MGFAEEMEGKAREFILRLINQGAFDKKLYEELYRDNRNFKPWYSPRGLIDRGVEGAERVGVLIGVNPAGCPAEYDQTTVDRCWEQPISLDKPFNAFLDESWENQPPGNAKLQVAVQDVFKELYNDWKNDLRNTVCFNVCPIRTHDAGSIPDPVWDASVKWCLEVLECLKPNRIICFAVFTPDGKPARRSPWHAINRKYQIKPDFCANVKRSRDTFPAFVLACEARKGALSGCEVIGIPHLSYHHGNKKMYDELRQYLAQQ